MQSAKTQSKCLENKLAFPPTNLHHGLLNKIGENNCFLNVTIQALWHLGPFRTELKKFINTFSAKPDQIESGGLMEAVCNMFVQYEFTDQEVLPPTELRESLGNLSGRYELGKIADANEAFDSILHKIHAEQSATCPHKKKCLSHRVFGGLVMEQTVCTKCRATSEPTLRSDFILCFQALELINEARDMITNKALDAVAPDKKAKPDKHTLRSRIFGSNHDLAKGEKNETDGESASLFDKNDFGRLLHKCMEVNVRSCPSIDDPHNSAPNCEGKGKVHFYSLEPPLAMALSVGWTQLNEEAQTLKDFYSLISYSMRLSDLFIVEGVSSTPGGLSSSAAAGPTGPSYTFRGLVCYYGMHYVSIFQESEILDQERYLLFDDQKIRPIGDWNAVIAECVKSKYQPVLLLYELDKNSAGYILDEDGDGEQQETRSMYEIHECDFHDSSSHSTSTAGYMSTASSDKQARETKDTYQDVAEARAAVDSQRVMLDRLQQDMSDATVATVVPGSSSSVTVTVSTAKSNVSSQFGDSYSSSQAETAAASDAKHTKHHSHRSHHSHHHDSKGVSQHGDSHGEAVMDGEEEHIVGDSGLSLSMPDKVATPSSTDSASTSDHKSVAAQHKSGELRPYSDSTSFSKGTGRSYTDNNYSSQKHTVLPANYKAAIFQSNFYVQPSDSCKYTHNSDNNNSSSIQFDGIGPFSTSFRNRNSSEPLKIAKWSYRSLKYNVLLEQEWLDDGKRTLGIRLEHDIMNHIVVTSFYRNPFTGGMLPAERCKKIERNDRIVAVNGVEVTTVTALQKFLYDVPSDRVIMELESSTKLNLWFQCPACSMSNLVDEGTETGLKEHNNGRMEAHRRVKSWGKFMIKCVACKTQSVADDSIV